MTTLTTPMQDEQTQVKAWPRPAAFGVLRVVLGLVLLTAAILKGWQLATEPTLEKGLLTSRWVLITGVEVEWLLSFWLLSGLRKRVVWWAVLACFIAFAGISLYKVASGEASCGCFGKLRLDPRFTLAGDLVVLALLTAAAPRQMCVRRTSKRSWRPTCLMVLATILGVPGALAMGSHQSVPMAVGMDSSRNSRLVILSPQKWLGQVLPVSRYIDVKDQLAHGLWAVVLYHHDCERCQVAIPKYLQMATEVSSSPSSFRLALIEIPPYDVHAATNSEDACLRGHLSPDYEWFVETPVELLLDQGVVRSVALGESRLVGNSLVNTVGR